MQNEWNKIPVSDRLNDRVNETLAMIQTDRRKKRFRRTVLGAGSAAAVLGGVLLVGTVDPVLASQIPLIGHLFEKVEHEVSYKGDFSKDAVWLLTEENAGEEQNAGKEERGTVQDAGKEGAIQDNAADGTYIRTSGGVTVTIAEMACSRDAVYLSVKLENEDGFPEDWNKIENWKGYQFDYDIIYLDAEAEIEGMDDVFAGVNKLEGKFEDQHTFVGVIRAEFGSRSADQKVELPDEFRMKLKLTNIYSKIKSTETEMVKHPEGDVRSHLVQKYEEYPGEWDFAFDINLNGSQLETVEIHKTNENGEGIAKVERTAYEITAEPMIPESANGDDYLTVICDADGDLLETQGNIEVYQIYGRNTDKVYVYLCDYVEYMDHLKGYYWSKDYEEKKQTKTFAEYLDEHALFGTEVTFH